jgi:hypothetical protein
MSHKATEEGLSEDDVMRMLNEGVDILSPAQFLERFNTL